MNFTGKINRTGAVFAFLFLSLIFSVGGAAQTDPDEPLGAEAAAALVKELKGVVMRISPDKDESKLVAEKFDKHKDLGCKTKNEVIDLLFEDVKSVIKDSGTQYQIYSVFSFYKNVDNDSSEESQSRRR